MQKNTTENYFSLRNLNERNLCFPRASSSGFNYPEQFSFQNALYPCIPETKYPSKVPPTTNQATNGFYQKRLDVSYPNFLSENDVNVINRNHISTQSHTGLDPRHFYNEAPLPRFSSTPYITQTSVEYLPNQGTYPDVRLEHSQPFTSSQFYNSLTMATNIQRNSNSQMNKNENSGPYHQYVLYDARTNSYQNVIFYTHNPSLIHLDQHVGEGASFIQTESFDYEHIANLSSEKEFCPNLKDCQLNLAQQNTESNIFSGFVEEDLMYFLQSKSSNDLTDLNRAESQSMPSLHGDDSITSDFDNSEDDKLHTVHGEHMLQELQKLSSIFTNVVNLPKSVKNDQIGSSQSNLSRFKKTRIKERTTAWRMGNVLVKDNLVKIIPDKVLDTKKRSLENFDQLENEIFGCEISKQTDLRTKVADHPDCIHSRYLKHSNRASHKYKLSFNVHSPSDLNNSVNQQTSSSKSSRQFHRKSLQIPIRIPLVWNPMIPLVSPTIPHSRKLFESSRNKRRWSVCGNKVDNHVVTQSSRPYNLRHAGDVTNSVSHDNGNEHVDNLTSFDFDKLCERSNDFNYHKSSSLEYKLDKKLASVKSIVMSHIESNMSEIKFEIQNLKEIQANLTKEITFYKDRVNVLEECIRTNLPQDKWKLFGINSGANNNH